MSEIKRGEIYYIESGTGAIGHEQHANRPAVILSDYPDDRIVTIVYLTTKEKADSPLHVSVKSSAKNSTAICEQVTTVDKSRVKSFMGVCSKDELAAIEAGVLSWLGLAAPNIEESEQHDLDYYDELAADNARLREQLSETERENSELFDEVNRAEARAEAFHEIITEILRKDRADDTTDKSRT